MDAVKGRKIMNSLLNRGLRVRYYFSEPELKSCDEYPARSILYAINKLGNGLELFRTEGTWTEESTMTVNKSFIYRLRSQEESAEIDFGLTADGHVMVLILVVNPMVSGNGFRLKKFLISKVAKTLFEAGFVSIRGAATMNDKPMRKTPKGDFRRQKAKSGINKLVQLYLHFGFEQQGGTDSKILELTRERFGQLFR